MAAYVLGGEVVLSDHMQGRPTILSGVSVVSGVSGVSQFVIVPLPSFLLLSPLHTLTQPYPSPLDHTNLIRSFHTRTSLNQQLCHTCSPVSPR